MDHGNNFDENLSIAFRLKESLAGCKIFRTLFNPDSNKSAVTKF